MPSSPKGGIGVFSAECTIGVVRRAISQSKIVVNQINQIIVKKIITDKLLKVYVSLTD